MADDLSHRTWALRGWHLDRLALCALQQDRGSELAEEDPDITLVIIYRLRSLARRPWVPQRHYGEVRRRLLDKITTHDLHFTMKSFDLGGDEREVV